MCSVFFWVIPRRPSFNSRRFGTLYRFHLHRQVYEVLHRPAYEDGTDRVPKRRLLKLGRRGITQKKTLHNTGIFSLDEPRGKSKRTF